MVDKLRKETKLKVWQLWIIIITSVVAMLMTVLNFTVNAAVWQEKVENYKVQTDKRLDTLEKDRDKNRDDVSELLQIANTNAINLKILMKSLGLEYQESMKKK